MAAAITGMAAAGMMLFTLVRLLGHISQTQSDAAQFAKENPFGILNIAFANNMGLDWGWLPLISGALLVVYGGLTAPRRTKPSVEASASVDPDAAVRRFMAECEARARQAAEARENRRQREGEFLKTPSAVGSVQPMILRAESAQR